MDAVHLHLVLNHFPIFAVLIGLGILAAAFVLKSAVLKRTALVLFFAAGVVTIPVYLSGEGGEEKVEHLSGVSEDRIEAHEDAAKPALISALVLAAVSLAALLACFRCPGTSRWLTLAALACALAVFGLMLRAANLGGQIRHPEIIPGGAAAVSTGHS